MPFLKEIILNNTNCSAIKFRKESYRQLRTFLTKPYHNLAEIKAKEPKKNFRKKRHGFPCFRLAASLTLEAAIALPAMIFAMYTLMFPLHIMDAERQVQNLMETVTKDLAIVEYAQEMGQDALDSSKWSSVAGALVDGVETGAAMAAVLSSDKLKYFRNPRFSDDTAIFSSEDGQDSAMVYMELEYEPDFPTSFFTLMPFEMSIVANRRAWVGSEGGRGRSLYGQELDDEDSLLSGELSDDTVVYIAKNSAKSGVYHLDPDCHYISNGTIQSGDKATVETLTNESGAKYHSCPSCDAALAQGTVYYFPSGSAYHSDPNCKALRSYVEVTTYGEIDSSMHSCPYCGVTH